MNDETKSLDEVEATPAPVVAPEAPAESSVEEVTGPAAVTPIVTGRYSVSRKGMGGRKPKYDVELLTELLKLQQDGTSLLAECQRRGLPYVSINSAMKRVGLK